MLRRAETNDAIAVLAERLAQSKTARPTTSGGKGLLTGRWLGHALHPVLTDFADGAWMAGSFLDLFGSRGAAPAAQRLVGFGLSAAVPTALTGLAEWTDTDGKERRVGFLHLLTSSAAFALYGCSYVARRRGKHTAGVALGVIGGVVAILDGYVGGHLTLAMGVGVGQNVFLHPPEEWTFALDVDELPENSPTPVSVAGTELVIVRSGDQVFALAGHCSYRGAPLHEGLLSDDAIVCPGHGCRFRLGDGAVLGGPASLPQPVLGCRVTDGRVEVIGRGY